MVSSFPIDPEDSPLRGFESRQLHQGAWPASVSPRRCAQVLPVTATFSSQWIPRSSGLDLLACRGGGRGRPHHPRA